MMKLNWNDFVKTREYYAIVEGRLDEKEGRITSYLKENKNNLVYSTKEINNETQFNNFYNTLLEVSTIDTGVTASYGDKFLTLFTCSEENLDYRVAVVEKQIY